MKINDISSHNNIAKDNLKQNNKEIFLVTSALPYANGPLHVGHLAGAYLNADIFAKHQKMRKNQVLFICGTDEHGAPIALSAKKENLHPRIVALKYRKNIENSFQKLNIRFHIFFGTSDPEHHELSKKFFLTLKKKKYLTTHETNRFFCPKDKMFLPDRFVQGICPKCFPEHNLLRDAKVNNNIALARGDECPQCGAWLEPEMLIQPQCKICATEPMLKSTQHQYLCLNKFKSQLTTWLASKKEWKPETIHFIMNIVNQNMDDRPITRDLDWGIPSPEGHEKSEKNKVLYVWFEAPIGYISGTIIWAKQNKLPETEWKKFWMNPKCKIIHFIGKDNLVFHAIMWPSILAGQSEPYTLPHSIVSNHHLLLENQKISTSQGHVLWVDDVLELFPADFLRYFICSILPENKDTNFSATEFQRIINAELKNEFGNLTHRILSFVHKYFQGTIVGFDINLLSPEFIQWKEKVEQCPRKVATEIDQFHFKKALETIFFVIRSGNILFNQYEPWKKRTSNPMECQQFFRLNLWMLEALACMLFPFMPNIASQLWNLLGLKGSPEEIDWNKITKANLNEPRQIPKPKILIAKIEDKDIELLTQKIIHSNPSEQSHAS